MKFQCSFHRRPKPQETDRGAYLVRHTRSVLRTFRPVCLPLGLLQELRRYDAQGAKLQPLAIANMADRLFNHFSDNLLDRPRFGPWPQ
jgi:hypothetical protein